MRNVSFLLLALLILASLSCSTESTPVYTLTTTATPAEGGAITPNAGSYDEGETISLQASANEGWVFAGWQGDVVSTANPINLSMTQNFTMIGSFEQRMYALTVDVNGEGTVAETVVQQKATDYAEGTVVELEAVPEENWVFARWEGDLSGSDNPAEITVDEPKNIVAAFATLPTVITGLVESITDDSAQSGGDVTDDGGSEVTSRGVCWSTLQDPTMDCTSNGSGTGTFTSNFTNLSSNTEYFVRAYATNGAGTAYGNQINFTTDSSWPRDTDTEVVEVTSATGRVWMDRNMGASRAATSSTDEQAYGDLYQWGRAADGHEKRTSRTTSVLSNTDIPGDGQFILPPNSPSDWRSPQNDNLWQGVKGINNPCPHGYRLPTEGEWEAERQSWSSNDRNGAFASPLKLPVAGYRGYSSGSLDGAGNYGLYWSATIVDPLARRLDFTISSAAMNNLVRADGVSVRCIKN